MTTKNQPRGPRAPRRGDGAQTPAGNASLVNEYFTEAQVSGLIADYLRVLEDARRGVESGSFDPAWWDLAVALRDVSDRPTIAANLETSLFVHLLHLLVIDPSTHASGGPLQRLESTIARHRVGARYGDRREAREWVRELWQREGHAFDSKSDFARLMARRLLNERGLEVKDRTIREDWLKGLEFPGLR